MPETKMPEEPEESNVDYFAMDTPHAGPAMGDVFWSKDEPQVSMGIKLKDRPLSRRGSTKKAGDLLTMSRVDHSDPDRSVSFSPFATPRLDRTMTASGVGGRGDDFDLRDAVMECISKAIGLVQHSSTPAMSAEASPMVHPQDEFRQKAVFNSSFGSLSFLGLQGLDDGSSITASSAASFSDTDLENEVKILYFPKGSTLVQEGEKNAGLYFVIEGFLDVSMPESDAASSIKQSSPTTNIPTSTPSNPSRSSGGEKHRGPFRPPQREYLASPTSSRFERPVPASPSPKPESSTPSIPLFTVKPGGIAGYLSSLSGFPSYVDIKAKTECYVGFLPAKALERIMDRKPIVLLTLAKRLISLLSPLSMFGSDAFQKPGP